MQKVGEDRKKEKKGLERAIPVGDPGLLPGLLLQNPQFLHTSPINPTEFRMRRLKHELWVSTASNTE